MELLEKESSALAERLVRGQVDRAEGEEETFVLEREVNTDSLRNTENSLIFASEITLGDHWVVPIVYSIIEHISCCHQVQALRRANMDAQQRIAVMQDEIRSLEMTIAEVRDSLTLVSSM